MYGSILENGILSANMASSIGISIDRNNMWYNGSDFISLSESLSINDRFSYGSFNIYIKRNKLCSWYFGI